MLTSAHQEVFSSTQFLRQLNRNVEAVAAQVEERKETRPESENPQPVLLTSHGVKSGAGYENGRLKSSLMKELVSCECENKYTFSELNLAEVIAGNQETNAMDIRELAGTDGLVVEEQPRESSEHKSNGIESDDQ